MNRYVAPLIVLSTPAFAHDVVLPHTHDISLIPMMIGAAVIAVAAIAATYRKGSRE